MKGGAEHGSNVLSRLRSAPRTERGSLTSWYFALFALTPAICPQTRGKALLLHQSSTSTFLEKALISCWLLNSLSHPCHTPIKTYVTCLLKPMSRPY